MIQSHKNQKVLSEFFISYRILRFESAEGGNRSTFSYFDSALLRSLMRYIRRTLILKFLNIFEGMALEKAPVSIRALTANEKSIGKENKEVRGLLDSTIIEDKGEREETRCGSPSFFSCG